MATIKLSKEQENYFGDIFTDTHAKAKKDKFYMNKSMLKKALSDSIAIFNKTGGKAPKSETKKGDKKK